MMSIPDAAWPHRTILAAGAWLLIAVSAMSNATSAHAQIVSGEREGATPGVTVKDPKDDNVDVDVRSVSGQTDDDDHDSGFFTIHVRKNLKAGQGAALYFDFDEDKYPEVAVTGYWKSTLNVYSMKTWTKVKEDISSQGCVTALSGVDNMTFYYDPECLAPDSNTTRISAMGFGGSVDRFDYAPGKRAWSKTFATYA